MTDDDDRAAYLAGEAFSVLDPEERRALDGIRDLLADPAVWKGPGAGLEAEIIAAIGAESGSEAPTRPERRRPERQRFDRRRLLVAAAAVVVVLAAGAVAFSSSRDDSPAAQHFAVTLKPTALARDATGDATLTRTPSGWRIALHATGLPRLDNGRYYQAWLKNAAGTLVPIGTFNDARDVTLWAGVTPLDFATITITIETADGNQASSERAVMVGTISR